MMLPSFLFHCFIVVLLLLELSVASALSGPRELDKPASSGCIQSKLSCGSITIKYPFRPLNGSQQCGYPIDCIRPRPWNSSHVMPIIEINSVQYKVIAIDYANKTLHLLHKAMVDVSNGGDCSHLLKMDAAMNIFPFTYTDSNLQLSLYYNCSSLPSFTTSSNYYKLPCSLSKSMDAYIAFGANADQFADYCANKTKTAIFQSAKDNKSVFVVNDYGMLLQGFEVTWAYAHQLGPRSSCVCESSRYNSSAPIRPFCERSLRNAYRDTSKFDGLPPPPSAIILPVISKAHDPGKQPKGRRVVLIIIGGFVSVAILVAACIMALLIYFRYCQSSNSSILPIFTKKDKARNSRNVEAFLETFGSLAPKRYSFSEIEKMTNNFSEKLGQGGFGSVYKGKLDSGRLVAVKLLKSSRGSGKDFSTEVISIGCTYHVNIVSLLGFCLQGSKRALIYEFMSNGSLDKFIFSNEKFLHLLSWEKRYHMLHIAIGVARGLDYLHRGCNIGILHFDIKPHNILLDGEYCAKIADFGLAKLCQSEQSVIPMLGGRGTLGYMAPEAFNRRVGEMSSKADVYSFGVLILEMIGGRKNIDLYKKNSSEIYFPKWIHGYLGLEGDHVKQALGVTTIVEDEIIRKMAIVGLWCVQLRPADRPTMCRVMAMLEDKMEELPIPPMPSMTTDPLPVPPPLLACVESTAGQAHEADLVTPPSART